MLFVPGDKCQVGLCMSYLVPCLWVIWLHIELPQQTRAVVFAPCPDPGHLIELITPTISLNSSTIAMYTYRLYSTNVQGNLHKCFFDENNTIFFTEMGTTFPIELPLLVYHNYRQLLCNWCTFLGLLKLGQVPKKNVSGMLQNVLFIGHHPDTKPALLNPIALMRVIV